MTDHSPCDHSFDPLLNSLATTSYRGTSYKGKATSRANAVHSATIAVLAMLKLGSTGILAIVGQGNCDEPWHWLVTAKHHHAGRCDALSCLQGPTNCDACHQVEAATPDLHGCEHHGANRTLHALLLEWLCESRELLAEVADQLGQTGLWCSASATQLPATYPYESMFGHHTSRIAGD